MMKILAIRNSWKVAGAELYYLKLADAFREYKIDCELILITNNEDLAQRALKKGIDVHIVNTFGEEVGTKRGLIRLALNLPDYLFKYLTTIYRIRRNSKPDIIVMSGKTEKYALTILLRLFGYPVIWLEHGRVFTHTMAREALLIYKAMSHFCSIILAEAHDTEYDLLRNKIAPSKIQYIGSGIDTEQFSIHKSNLRENIIVGFMATLNWEKGILEYLKTASKVCRKNLKIKFLIIGDGPQLKYARKYVQDNNLRSRITFTGYLENPKNTLKHVSILLSPIHHPGALSLSVMEAMSMEIVPIVTDIGGNRELVVNGVTGFIYKNSYPKKAAESILELYENKNLLKRISVSARKYIERNYSVKILASKWYLISEKLN